MLYAMPDSVTVRRVPSTFNRVRSHAKCRSSTASKSPPDKVTDSGQVSESFSGITTFSGSTTPKRYANNGLGPPTSLRPFNAVYLPLI